ncbi:septation protein SpoVG family protein [bacterium]|nr:septation protein SpoVG family protein [candidate division CSSED10-310 bacterium]
MTHRPSIEDLLDSIQIRIIPFDAEITSNRIRAYVELDIGGVLTIRGIKIIETRQGGIFIGFPSVRKPDGTYRDLVLINDKEFLSGLRKRILDRYHHFTDSAQNGA